MRIVVVVVSKSEQDGLVPSWAILLLTVVGRPRVLVAGPVPVPGVRDTVEGGRRHYAVGSAE